MNEETNLRKTAPAEEAEQPAAEKDAAAVPAEQAEPDFETLIRGKYREAYLRSVAELLAAQAEDRNRYERYRALRAEAEAIRAEDPSFDLNQALENPRFALLLRDGVDLRTARAAVGEGAARRPSDEQPLENGLGSRSMAAVFRTDPRSLTKEQRRQIRRRAAKGEEIVW